MTGVSDAMSVRWSKDEYRLPTLYDMNKFPVIAMVMTGYCGDTQMETVSTGDMLRIHGRAEQKRAIAKDCTSGRYYSIPLDSSIPFHVSDQPSCAGRQSVGLADLLSRVKLPCTVDIDLDSIRFLQQQGEASRQVHFMTRLEIQEVYEAKYLTANSIISGRLYAEILSVPTYLGATLVLAKGLSSSNSTQAQWEKHLAKWSSAADNIDFSKFKHSQQIMVYSSESVEKGNHVYETLEPNIYLSLAHVREQSDESPYDVLPKKQTPGVPRSQSVDYLNPNAIKDQLKISQYPPGVTSKPAMSAKPKVDLVAKKAEYSGPSNIKKVQDIPEDAKTLTCEDVVACLYLMNMSKYADVFRENQINGELLASLSNDMLVEELNVNKIHAHKLDKFINEKWRPDPPSNERSSAEC